MPARKRRQPGGAGQPANSLAPTPTVDSSAAPSPVRLPHAPLVPKAPPPVRQPSPDELSRAAERRAAARARARRLATRDALEPMQPGLVEYETIPFVPTPQRNVNVPTCPKTGKAKYLTKRNADRGLAKLQRLVETGEAEDRGVLPVRSYQCPWCSTWHWTSDAEAFEAAYRPSGKVSDKKERKYKKPTGRKGKGYGGPKPLTPIEDLPDALR